MQQPGIPSHDPDYNAAARGDSMPSSPRLKNVPMCKGGARAKSCLFDERCHITEAGCQVCVCGDLR